MKKALSLFLSLIMLFGTVAIGGSVLSLEASAATYKAGDIIYFGSYPQSKVTDSYLKAALNKQSGIWTTYNYYSGTATSDSALYNGQMSGSAYMQFKDVTYYGNKYRAVRFESYRPIHTGYTSCAENSCQDDNGYYTNNVYWFKYEPIKWRVLDPNEGLVMCASAIDAQAYNNYIVAKGNYFYGDKDGTYFASNYAKSSVRSWLKNSFYTYAFSTEQKANIKSTTITTNSQWSSYFNSASTTDKVFLLSYEEVLNSAYGFKTDASSEDTAKALKCTDYAKAQGCSNLNWLLRTPDKSDDVYGVSAYGSVGQYYSTDSTEYGIVPALRLSDLSYSDSAKCSHSSTYTKTENKIEASCVSTGKYDEVVYCSNCNEVMSRVTTVTPVTAHKDSNKDGKCDECGNKMGTTPVTPGGSCEDAYINYAPAKTVDYRTKVTIKATATNVPEGYFLVMTVGGTEYKGDNKEVTCEYGEIKGDVNYTLKVVDANGNVQNDGTGNPLTAEGGKITCKAGFIQKLIAFFKGLFGSLPAVTIKP